MFHFTRYNVIVKGLAGKPLTIKMAILKIILIYLFATIWTLAPIFGWNRYKKCVVRKTFGITFSYGFLN